tara:strand:+ start:364 stop:501 length:138 start_codon:yes stop_codon:yes gene_type:complete
MPEGTLVKIAVSVPTKQLMDKLKGSLTYTEFLLPLVEKDSKLQQA